MYMSIPIATLLLGSYFLLRKSQVDRIRNFRPVMGLMVAYLANALFCLTLFSGDGFDLQVGAYFVLLTVVTYLLQIVLVLGPWGPRDAGNPVPARDAPPGS